MERGSDLKRSLAQTENSSTSTKLSTKRNTEGLTATNNDEIEYHCDQCKYVATRKGRLKIHIESEHERVRYHCDHCDYFATEKRHL